ncbi:hypothetical protein GKA92_24020 [Salmonella enterica subsp. enterica]|nr:hypothetical protein [Salmonella enterica subsp. enterica serovar Abaetetuba]
MNVIIQKRKWQYLTEQVKKTRKGTTLLRVNHSGDLGIIIKVRELSFKNSSPSSHPYMEIYSQRIFLMKNVKLIKKQPNQVRLREI